MRVDGGLDFWGVQRGFPPNGRVFRLGTASGSVHMNVTRRKFKIIKKWHTSIEAYCHIFFITDIMICIMRIDCPSIFFIYG